MTFRFTSDLATPSDKGQNTKTETKLNKVVYAVHCSEDCSDLNIRETKQPLHRRMAQHSTIEI